MRRVIFEDGDKEDSESSFATIYVEDSQVDIACSSGDELTTVEPYTTYATVVDAPEFLAGLARARLGDPVVFQPHMSDPGLPKTRVTFQGSLCRFDTDLSRPSTLNGVIPLFTGRGIVQALNFDSVFLDSFSVIENNEPRRRQGRDIPAGPIEQAIIDAVSKTPEALRNFSPRAFEVFVGSLLTKLGFSRVRLSRYSRDGGYDVYGIYCEGDHEYSTVVEVKHYRNRGVGIAIVDRLNGVRERMGADRAVVFTTSFFSAEAKRAYTADSKRIALIDYERIVDLLSRCSGWSRTPSDLWSLPRLESVSTQPVRDVRSNSSVQRTRRKDARR